VKGRPIFEHHHGGESPLECGYLPVTLPTQFPSVALGDLMGHTRAVPTREDRDEVQDIGPRLLSDGVAKVGDPQEYPKYKIDAFDEGVGEHIEDECYEEQYEDATREDHEAAIKDEP
jgi:hypothetical protein